MHFQQTRPNDGYLVQFCKQYLDRLYACLDAIKVLFTKLDQVIGIEARLLKMHKKSHDTARYEGAEPIVYCFRKMHLWESKSHAVYSIPLCFYLGWSAYFGTMSKFVSGLFVLYTYNLSIVYTSSTTISIELKMH